ncbi:hypothetical protein ACFL1L_01675 [Thermoplasmatota archaeon]
MSRRNWQYFSVLYLVAFLLADYDVDLHHILKPPERQKEKEKME